MRMLKSKIPNKTILFVCVENAARSQMAEAFFRYYSPKGYEAKSAGTKQASKINALAVKVMKEINIDISHQKPKTISVEMIKNSDKIVNMGCLEKESCPTLFLHNFVDWNIGDLNGESIGQVRDIRNEIEQRVKELVSSLKYSK